MTPWTVENPSYPLYSQRKMIPVPCGKCPSCLQRRINDWSFRLMQEEKRSISAAFLTLTYNTRYVPITNNGYMTLKKKDVQNYWKRLRKLHVSDQKIKYYVCGEYGSKRHRPHYHAIVFNADPDDLVNAWKLDGEFIGQCHLGTVSVKSIMYVLNYMNKASSIPCHRNDDRIPCFSMMSKNMGLNYLTDAIRKFHLTDFLDRPYVLMPDGWKQGIPRYYKLKLYDEEQLRKLSLSVEARFSDLDKDFEIYDQYVEHELKKWNNGKSDRGDL